MFDNITIKEYPRNGSANAEVMESGQERLLCVLALDTSTTMDPYLDQLRAGVGIFFDTLRQDPYAMARVEVCIITFDDEARIVVPCTDVGSVKVPTISCGGTTAMHQAVDLAMEQIQIRKEQYKKTGTDYSRPWLFLMTDGMANDPDSGAFQRLMQAQRDKHLTAFPIAIGDNADKEILHQLREDHLIFTVEPENLRKCFQYLSNSVTVGAKSQKGQKAYLENPVEYQIGVEM